MDEHATIGIGDVGGRRVPVPHHVEVVVRGIVGVDNIHVGTAHEGQLGVAKFALRRRYGAKAERLRGAVCHGVPLSLLVGHRHRVTLLKRGGGDGHVDVGSIGEVERLSVGHRALGVGGRGLYHAIVEEAYGGRAANQLAAVSAQRHAGQAARVGAGARRHVDTRYREHRLQGQLWRV